MKIYLIRHGQTEANLHHLYCGSTDLPLSEAGREALNGIRYPKPDVADYITSGMGRCNETMELLFHPESMEVCPDLREIDFGVFEMRGYGELKDDPDYQAWISGDNMANTPPNGESGLDMTRRVMAAFREILRRGKDAVIVTHGGVIAAIMAESFTGENRNRYQWQPAPGCGYLLTFTHRELTYESLMPIV